jgi:hypothetical protein
VLVLVAGLAKLDHHPGDEFLELFVDACMATRLQGFKPQDLANVINGGYAFGSSSRHHVVLGSVAVLMAGLAKLDHNPGTPFMELFVNACISTRLQGFNPQTLSNVINGECASGISSRPSRHVELSGLC